MNEERIDLEMLERVRNAPRDIQSIREGIERVRAGLERITQNYRAAGKSDGWIEDRMAAGQSALEALEAELRERKMRHLRDIQQLIHACAELKGLEGAIVWEYYIDCRSAEQIARNKHYSADYVRKILSRWRKKIL